jgi:Domain of unknown function (DUF1707)
MPVTTGPEDPAAAGGDRLRACHADREQVIGTLQAAFGQGRLTRDELDARAGQALAARTYADLAALIADIPAGPAARPARQPALAHRRPLARAAVKAGICLIVAAAALWGAALADPGGPPNPSHSRALPLFVLAQIAALAVPVILAHGVVTSWKLRRSRRQLPRRPGPGGYALDGERRASTGHGPVPPGLRTDLRADKSREHRQRISARAGRAPRGVRPSPGAA